ncbi:uncharacterized protein LOC141865540 [Acropora palmata]|uniref:uncharacterized protein LOC141865540 n=1 Tax=Acropora palmata TaxID=6131 RepID=UPI003DA1B46A
MATNLRGEKANILWMSAITLIYFNSSINPVLYCWKMKQISRCERVNLKIDHVLWNECKHGRILEVFPLTFMMEMTKNGCHTHHDSQKPVDEIPTTWKIMEGRIPRGKKEKKKHAGHHERVRHV